MQNNHNLLFVSTEDHRNTMVTEGVVDQTPEKTNIKVKGERSLNKKYHGNQKTKI